MSETLVIEREIRHPREKLWRALTEPHLIAEWLMNNDFRLAEGHRFKLTAEWGSVDCQVLEIMPNQVLSYSWSALGLESTVTFTLTPTPRGTLLRMEQQGFASDSDQNYRGAIHGWNRFLARLDEVTGTIDG